MDGHLSPRCTRCGGKAVQYRRESGESTCKACFFKEIESRVRRTIRRHSMLTLDDKVALGLSGGKDSVALVELLHAVHGNLLRQQAQAGKGPVAITIDEGIAGYREESLEIAKVTCEKFGLRHVVFSFKEEFGKSLDEMVSMGDKIQADPARIDLNDQLKNAASLIFKPCSICGVLRRRLLDDLAAAIGATKIATGHNLNDEVETFLLNMFKGDTARIERASMALGRPSPHHVHKIKPLREVSQRDLVLYLYYKDGLFQEVPCPYSRREGVFRGEIQGIINQLEAGHPGVLHAVDKFIKFTYGAIDAARTARKNDGSPHGKQGTISTCVSCGKPKSKGLRACMACYYTRLLIGKEYTAVLDTFTKKLG